LRHSSEVSPGAQRLPDLLVELIPALGFSGREPVTGDDEHCLSVGLLKLLVEACPNKRSLAFKKLLSHMEAAWLEGIDEAELFAGDDLSLQVTPISFAQWQVLASPVDFV
jgi:hypothetical protein